MPHPAYGYRHQRIRKIMLANVYASADPVPCPGCKTDLRTLPPQRIHLGHVSPESKAAGEPGSIAVCAKCNIGEGARIGWQRMIDNQIEKAGLQPPVRDLDAEDIAQSRSQGGPDCCASCARAWLRGVTPSRCWSRSDNRQTLPPVFSK